MTNIIPRAPVDDPDEGPAGEQASPPTDAAEKDAARRSAELELVAALLDPAASPEDAERRWNDFAHQAFDYAFRRLMALSRTGRIFKEGGLRQFEGPRPLPPKDWTLDDRTEIAQAAIGEAFLRFRDKNALRDWNPDRKSLFGWFLTNCKMLYADAYNAWVRGSQVSKSIGRGEHWYPRVFIDDEEEGERATLRSPHPSPEERVIQLARIDLVMAPTPFPDDVQYRQSHMYRAYGYTALEACQKAGITRDQHNKRTKSHRELLQGADGDEDQLHPAADQPDPRRDQLHQGADQPDPDKADPPGAPPNQLGPDVVA